MESQTTVIDFQFLGGFSRDQKEAASEAFYGFLFLHTTDGAQQLVELQDENGPEAWRQMSIRFDPCRAASRSPNCPAPSRGGSAACKPFPRRLEAKPYQWTGNC